MMRRMLTAAALAALAAPAHAGEPVEYEVAGSPYRGYLAMPADQAEGLVLIIHDWDGLGDYERRRADMLAELGYAAFAADLYGAGNRPDTLEGKRSASGALYADRAAMRERMSGALAAAREHVDLPAVVMGYCFGGTAALEFARAGGEDVRAFASFHGGLETPDEQSWQGVDEFILVMHGGADQVVPMSDLTALVGDLEQADTPYEVQIYSGAPHSFTVFGTESYRERAEQESWAAFTDLIEARL